MDDVTFAHGDGEGDEKKAYAYELDSPASSSDLTAWRILKLTHEGQHRTGRKLLSTFALFILQLHSINQNHDFYVHAVACGG